MHIHVSLKQEAPQQKVSVALVVDVLRATTCALTYIERHAQAVWLTQSTEQALGLAAPQRILAGEQDGLKLDGFALGNSPLEAAARDFSGQTVIMRTSNGTNAAHLASEHAPRLLLSCLRNAQATAAAVQTESVVWILCAATQGEVSLDDVYTAGALVHELQQVQPKATPTTLSDAAQLSLCLYRDAPALDIFGRSKHGQHLQNLGVWSDVEYAAQANVSQRLVTWCGVEHGALVFRGA